MKQFYSCEKCGTQYESYDEAYACEESHMCVTTIGFDTELAPFATWKKDSVVPNSISLVTEEKQVYDPVSESWKNIEPIFAEYRLNRILPACEVKKIMEAHASRIAKEEEDRQKWMEEYNARKVKKEAE